MASRSDTPHQIVTPKGAKWDEIVSVIKTIFIIIT